MIIATHSGTFHADEAFAVFMLKLLPRFASADLVRTRDADQLAKADVLVDVGGEFDPERHRYDHHQRGFFETFDEQHKTKLSSAGLFFGKEVIATILEWELNDVRLEALFQKVYDEFVEGFDGVDNGINRYPPDVKPLYKDSTSISSRVARLNPWWNEEGVDMHVRFLSAVEMVGKEFVERVKYLGLSWMQARSIVVDAIDQRHTVHNSGKVLLFEQFCPWKEHLHNLEEEKGIVGSDAPVYVVYPDESKKWRVQAVPVTPDSFESRKALPEPWRGLRDDELSIKCNIEQCIFVHSSGFIGGAHKKDGALQMAIQALAF
ncbi:hypothetical protein HDU97_000829 [Phlyctochytrium planicorne]|nr:hypothetical protein HDU97_000829 [Phlyctochytrium planicorne]